MLVVDASAVVELLLSTDVGGRVALRIADPDDTLHAPELLGVEVISVLRRLVSARQLTATHARQALADLEDLGIELYSHRPLLARALELGSVLTAYDGVYMALAEALRATFLTCDAKLANVRGHRAIVELVRAA